MTDKTIAIIGAGGIGGYVVEELSRLKCGRLIIVDGDIFNESNLNRQLYSNKDTLGKNKAVIAAKRAKLLNSEADIRAVDDSNISSILKDVNLIMDCVDNIETRLLLEDYASKNHKIIVHMSVYNSFGQVASVLPNSGVISALYKDKTVYIGETNSYTPATIASIGVSEAYKILLNCGQPLYNKVLLIDLFNNQFIISSINAKDA